MHSLLGPGPESGGTALENGDRYKFSTCETAAPSGRGYPGFLQVSKILGATAEPHSNEAIY